jgi:hypothetical protein
MIINLVFWREWRDGGGGKGARTKDAKSLETKTRWHPTANVLFSLSCAEYSFERIERMCTYFNETGNKLRERITLHC